MPIFDPYIERLFQIESGGNPYAVTGSNRGLGQFGPEEERQYGINASNRTDPSVQARAVQLEAGRESSALQKVLGRPPTAGELYLAHQQGLAGGPALLGAPYQTPAWQAIRPYYGSDRMAVKAISGNIPNGSPLKNVDPRQITAGQFADYWKGKFEGGMHGQSQIAAVSPRIAGPQIAGNPPVSNTVGGPPPGSVSGDLANPFQPAPISAPVPLPPEKPIQESQVAPTPPPAPTLAAPPVAPTSDVPASFSDRFNAIAPTVPAPVPTPAPPPINAPSPMNSPDMTFGHSPEAIQAAQAQGIWNPPTGQNLGGQPWNFPAMTPANPVLPSGAATNLPMLGLENPGAPFPSPFAPIPTNPDVQLPPPPPPIGNNGVQFAGGPALGAPQMPQTGGGLMGALGMGNMGGLGGLNFGALANLGGGQAPAPPQMQPDYGMQIAASMQPPSTAGLANLLQKYRALHLIA